MVNLDRRRLLPEGLQRTLVSPEYFTEILFKEEYGVAKVVGLVIRNTVGWQKPTDRISITQFESKMNISSRSTSSTSINTALEKGYIVRLDAETRTICEAWRYALPEVVNSESYDPDGEHLGNVESDTIQVPNWFFDKVLPREKRVTACIVASLLLRKWKKYIPTEFNPKTGKFGVWRMVRIPMSYADFEQATGMSRKGVAAGVAAAIKGGYIECIQKAGDRSKGSTSLFVIREKTTVPKWSNDLEDLLSCNQNVHRTGFQTVPPSTRKTGFQNVPTKGTLSTPRSSVYSKVPATSTELQDTTLSSVDLSSSTDHTSYSDSDSEPSLVENIAEDQRSSAWGPRGKNQFVDMMDIELDISDSGVSVTLREDPNLKDLEAYTPSKEPKKSGRKSSVSDGKKDTPISPIKKATTTEHLAATRLQEKVLELGADTYIFSQQTQKIWFSILRDLVQKGVYTEAELVSALCSYKDAGYPLDRPPLFRYHVNTAVRHELKPYDRAAYSQKYVQHAPTTREEQVLKNGGKVIVHEHPLEKLIRDGLEAFDGQPP